MTRVVNLWDRSSMVEQDAFNVEVVSSSLTGPTSYHIKIISTGATSQRGSRHSVVLTHCENLSCQRQEILI